MKWLPPTHRGVGQGGWQVCRVLPTSQRCFPATFPLFPHADEEPFLIFANRYYLRKLNLDGSNYTLLKQVRAELGAGGTPAPRGWDLGVEWALKVTGAAS